MHTQSTGQVRLLDLSHDSCRWPATMQSGRVEFFCGEPVVPGCSWCREHRALAFIPIRRAIKTRAQVSAD